MAKVFLSPSNQTNNIGVGSYGTEKYRMNQLADYVQQALQTAGIITYRDDPSKSKSDAVELANSLNVDCYVAIHSNASPASSAGEGKGPEMLVNGNRQKSQVLGQEIYDQVAGIYPGRGRKLKVRNDLLEINSPDAPSCLIEVAFHDNLDDANWILNNMPQIGTAISNGILTYLSLAPISDPTGEIDQQAPIPSVSTFAVGGIQTQDILYGRKTRILVQSAGGKTYDLSDLRCVFKASKTMLMEPNYSEITIYNLSADLENALIREGQRVVIEAGYEGQNYGVIFDGDIIQPIREKIDGTDYALTLIAMDGDRFLNFGFLSYSVSKGMSARTAAKDYASKASIPSELGNISKTLSDSKLTRGKVVFGLSRDYFRQLAKYNNASFYVDNGKVNLIKATDPPAGRVYDLSPTSGLIGTPAQTEYGASIKSLIIPSIKLNTLIHVDNKLIRERQIEIGTPQRTLDADGLYRVIAIEYSGDTRGTEWYAEYTTITQAGMLPNMISNGNVNPW